MMSEVNGNNNKVLFVLCTVLSFLLSVGKNGLNIYFRQIPRSKNLQSPEAKLRDQEVANI